MYTQACVHGCAFFLVSKIQNKHKVFIEPLRGATLVCVKHLRHLCYHLQELYANAEEELTGSVNAAHQWVNMTDVSIEIDSTHTVSVRKKRNTNPED